MCQHNHYQANMEKNLKIKNIHSFRQTFTLSVLSERLSRFSLTFSCALQMPWNKPSLSPCLQVPNGAAVDPATKG